MDQEAIEYLRRRERAERAAAKNASSEGARRAHQELAQGYAEIVRNHLAGRERLRRTLDQSI